MSALETHAIFLNSCVKMMERNNFNNSNYKYMKTRFRYGIAITAAVVAGTLYQCKPTGPAEVTMGDASSKVYVAPGKYDEFYNMVSGGFNGQIGVYGIPSGRLFRIIPVFSLSPE